MQYRITLRGKFIVSLLLMSVLVLGGMMRAEKNENEVSTNTFDTRTVNVQKLELQDISLETYALGQLSSEALYTVVSKIPGEVIHTNYSVGEHVNRGDILFSLDAEDFIISKKNQLQELNTSADEAKVQLEFAKIEYEKNEKLYATESIAQSELDFSENKYEQLKHRYAYLQTKIQSAQDRFKMEGDKYYVKSPVDGIITDQTVEKGMYTQGKEGYIITQSDPIIFQAGIAEKYINQLSVGQTAEVYINSIDKSVVGRIDSISFIKKGNTYPVEITIDNKDLKIKPGMFAEVYIRYKTIENAIALPPRAIVNGHDKHYIYLLDKKINEKHTVQKIPIQIVDRVYGKVIVTNRELLNKDLIVDGSSFINPETLVLARYK